VGFIKHQAVVAVVADYGTNTHDLDELRALLHEIRFHFDTGADTLLLGPADAIINGYSTFVLAPDGSKEGWADSDLGDRAREAFVSYFQTHCQCAAIVEVSFGEDYEAEVGATAKVRSVTDEG